jgi:hypothetical protein
MSDEQPPRPIKEYTLRQRLLAYVILFVFPLLLGFFAVRIILVAWPLKFGESSVSLLGFQVLVLVIAALMLALAVFILAIPIRRKITTGKFLLSRAETLQKARENWGKLGAGKPAGPQLWLWLLPAIFSLIALWLGALVMSLGWCSCFPATWGDRAAMALGILLIGCGLIYPFTAIRRKLRTGNFLPSTEELAKRRARCARPRSLRLRILTAGMWIVVAALWTWTAIMRMHRPHVDSFSPWFTAALSWLAAVVWTLQVFRPKPPQCALPLDESNSSN